MADATAGEQIATFDLEAVRRFADLSVAGLAAARDEIDALNVYPVPDGDTGTNMYLTMEAAREALRDRLAEGGDLRAVMTAYARGALLGARGNSGVILSQLLGALLRRMGQGRPGDRSATLVAEGLQQAAEAAYAAVGTPVEGTILTVAKAAAGAAAEAAAVPEHHLGEVLRAAAAEARVALERTPDQLALLRDAGVVDAGGAGLCVILEAAVTAVTGERSVAEPLPMAGRPAAAPAHQLPTGDLTEDGPAYEVMYLLEAEDGAVQGLRSRLQELGDSVVVVGGEGLWNVHVHTDDVGAAVEAGIEAGTPRRIRVTHFAEQLDRARERRTARAGSRRGRAVVAVVAGPGLAEVFGEAGAHVVEGGPGRRPSTGQVLEAVLGTGAEEVVVLPNDDDSVRVAEAAAVTAEGDEDVRVVVIPTRAQVQGIAAMAVHDPSRGFDADVVQMTAAAQSTRHGAVTVAIRQAMTSAGPCEPGDVLGVVGGDFAVVGSDLAEVAVTVLERLLSGGGELVTLVAGEGGAPLLEPCRSWVECEHPGVDVLVYEGGQERYPLLLAVE